MVHVGNKNFGLTLPLAMSYQYRQNSDGRISLLILDSMNSSNTATLSLQISTLCHTIEHNVSFIFPQSLPVLCNR